jgi:peroxiredoxin Q/BCP
LFHVSLPNKIIYMGNVTVGDLVPAFRATLQTGEEITESSIVGKKHILFFYPQDDTPTCTKEACNLRDNYSFFEQQGYTVLGISKDTAKKHQKFIDKYSLPFSLIADPEMSMLNAFGFFGPKMFMGKEVMGTYRTTVVTDEKGVITHLIGDVVAAEHTEQIKKALGL